MCVYIYIYTMDVYLMSDKGPGPGPYAGALRGHSYQMTPLGAGCPQTPNTMPRARAQIGYINMYIYISLHTCTYVYIHM